MRRLGTLPLMHQPGEKWMYNTGSDVLGVLIARAAGQSFEAFLRERIFEPLGMRDTGFSVAAGRRSTGSRRATRPTPTPARSRCTTSPGGQWSRPPAFPSGAGGLVSTVDDFLAFSQMLAELRHARRRAHPVAAVDRDDDHRSADAGAEGGVGSGARLVRQSRLGLRRGCRHAPDRPERTGRSVRLGRRAGHRAGASIPSEEMITILMTQKAWTSPNPPNVCSRFLDVGLRGNRRLTRQRWPPTC